MNILENFRTSHENPRTSSKILDLVPKFLTPVLKILEPVLKKKHWGCPSSKASPFSPLLILFLTDYKNPVCSLILWNFDFSKPIFERFRFRNSYFTYEGRSEKVVAIGKITWFLPSPLSESVANAIPMKTTGSSV